MSTRGALGFRSNGIDKVSYNHFDSYPSNLGMNVVDFIARGLSKDASFIDTLRKRVDKIKLVDEDMTVPSDQLDKCIKLGLYDGSVGQSIGGKPEPIRYYQALRGAQGDLSKSLKVGLMNDSSSFLGDSLMCEYAYILNLDTSELEFYIGFNRDENAPGRYTKLSMTDHAEPYYGVRLAATYKMDSTFNQNEVQADMERLNDEAEE